MTKTYRQASGRLLSAGMILLLVLGFTACNNSDELGFELTPPGERFAYFKDSTSVLALRTLRQDSLSTERRNPVLLGSAADDVFGRQVAGFVTQLRLTSSNVDFGEGVQLDSAILLLKYDGYHGDTLTTQHLKVYEVLTDLVFDSVYYSNQDLSTYYDPASSVAEVSFLPAPATDSLAFRVDDAIGQKILSADTSHLADNNTFLEFFKGLYFTTDPVLSGGAISYFDLAGEKSRLTLYYHNAEEDSLTYEVVINDNCTWFNVFAHDYSGSVAEPYINDSLYTDELAFIQAASGLRAGMSVTFSDSILKRAEDGIAINKAELILPVDQAYVNDLRLRPSNLSIFGAADDGTNEFIEDIFLGEDYYDGGYHSDRQAYVFNVARHVQNLLHLDPDKKIENKGLFLVISDSRVTANGLVLRNGGAAEGGIQLNITYTLVK